MMQANNLPLEWWQSLNNKELNLIIFVTEQCNFRCIYCYEDFKLGKISPEIETGVKNLISSRISDLENLSISFFGGEPLLNKESIINLASFSQEICKKFNVFFSGTITTNGYSLDDVIFSRFISLGINHYQITLDGDKETHDKLRPTLNKKPTFEKILENIISISKTNFEYDFVIRMNISDSNIESTKKLIYILSPILRGDVRFKFHFHPIFGHKELILNNQSVINELETLLNYEGLPSEGDSGPKVCYAAKFNSYSIRSNGVVQMCTVALDNEQNNIGKLNADGSLNIDEAKLKKWVFAENKGCPLISINFDEMVKNDRLSSIPSSDPIETGERHQGN